ncbi:Homeobox domain-containing protein [Fusarium sp. Ph1]|nr:Homeobox domain-containing protein [Fusarium sp. Ph1]
MAESTKSGKFRTESALTHSRVHAQDPYDRVLGPNSPGHGSTSDMTTDISSLELFTNQLGPLGDINNLNAFISADNFPSSELDNSNLSGADIQDPQLATSQDLDLAKTRRKAASSNGSQSPASDALASGRRTIPFLGPKVGTRFSREALKILKQWFDAHSHDPYPDDQTKEALQHLTGLNKTQLTNWLANARRRHKGSATAQYTPPEFDHAQTQPINIPRVGTPIPRSDAQNGLNPMQRWVDSPPEEEPAPISAIVRAISTSPSEPRAIHPESGKLCCVFCSQDDPDDDHIKRHNPSACQERAFNRKDHLKQHLRLVHGAGFIVWSMNPWKVSISHIRSRCGLCDSSIDTWQDRVNHLADHFKMGHTMASWKGDWGFDASILEMVENAIPPYLISTERSSPFPFRGSGTAANSPRTAYELLSLELVHFMENHYEEAGVLPRNDDVQLEACRIVFASEVLSSMEEPEANPPSSWLRDIITSNPSLSQQALFGPIRSRRENKLSSLEIKGKKNLFEECPLEAELRKFVETKQLLGQMTIENYELQHEACRVVKTIETVASKQSYDLVANWLVKIILESSHWLQGFRQRMHLPPAESPESSSQPLVLSADGLLRESNECILTVGNDEGGASAFMSESRASQPFWTETSPYMLNDSNFHERLGRELRRWVSSTMSPRNPQCHIPTDEELRHQARWIAYGDNDPWNQTHADNPEWLERFKQSVGIP